MHVPVATAVNTNGNREIPGLEVTSAGGSGRTRSGKNREGAGRRWACAAAGMS